MICGDASVPICARKRNSPKVTSKSHGLVRCYIFPRRRWSYCSRRRERLEENLPALSRSLSINLFYEAISPVLSCQSCSAENRLDKDGGAAPAKIARFEQACAVALGKPQRQRIANWFCTIWRRTLVLSLASKISRLNMNLPIPFHLDAALSTVS